MISIVNEVLKSKRNLAKVITISDITVCLVVRVSEANLWVLDRLQFILNYYDPIPRFLVIDLGSKSEYAQQVEHICNQSQSIVRYEHVKYFDEFSASVGRNSCLNFIETDLMFFTDVDIVHPKSFFRLLVDLSNDLEVTIAIRRCLFMPVYHLNEAYTQKFIELEDSYKSKFLREIVYLGQAEKFGSKCEFIAPYSNIFLIHKDFFDLSGGYSTSFIGYGSEDFEFLVRLGLLSSDIPVPNSFDEDLYGPTKSSFWEPRKYSGFRRYLEVLTSTSESLGLNAFHLWHEKPTYDGYWTKGGDKDRNIFKHTLKQYYPQLNKLIDIDYHNRSNDILCISKKLSDWEYFLPLRLLNYRVKHVTDLSFNVDGEQLFSEIKSYKYKKIFILEKGLLQNIQALLEHASAYGIEIAFIKEGIISGSLSYVDERKESLIFPDDHICNNRELAEAVFRALKFDINQVYNYDFFFVDLTNLEKSLHRSSILDEITFFLQNNSNYNFVLKIENLPYLKRELQSLSNVKILAGKDNIRVAVQSSLAVIILDSLNTELLSYIYNKKTYVYTTRLNIGDGEVISSLFSVFDLYQSTENELSDESQVIHFIDYLIYDYYSWISCNLNKSNKLQILNIKGERYYCGEFSQEYFFSKKSYLSWKHCFKVQDYSFGNVVKTILIYVFSIFLNKKKRKKLKESPDKFFKDSKNPVVRLILNNFYKRH